MSKTGRERILNLTTSKAEELIIQALDNPELYRALLLGPRASADAQRKAAAIVEKAILQSEVAGVRMLAIGSTQDN